VQCHTLDGTHSTGPTWKDMFGSRVPLSDGTTVLADENYVHDSVLYPSKQVVQGFQAVMPSYLGALKDKEIGWIIAFMKTKSANFKGGETTNPAAAPLHVTAPVKSAAPENK
jgi:cytochrome c oxidase subunit 2